ncbi:glycosyltransferase [Spirosoma foliorum]|uniref:Glycosyltransferase family 1 protein n=1 Tax=Spirosoma foliorum TaxID=2710596 RepID=A0A7G5H1L5_9BACT|nr:glycosyltransferase [Spirosoma foliorum]QMW05007.1 glycosyltransferase family 1 protein [Spirosoma foliorum]
MNNKRILIATMPLDGHLNPLTGLAKHLQSLGHDVRWYTGPSYKDKICKLGIPFYPFRKTREINQLNLDTEFPERLLMKGTIKRLRFDLNNVFFLRAPELVSDVKAIYGEFPFDLILCDAAFTGGPILQKLLNVPLVSIGIGPLGESSKGLPPSGLGIEPSSTLLGRLKQDMLRYLVTKFLLKPCTDVYNQVLIDHGQKPTGEFVFDALTREPDLYLQSGTPGFEYSRPDMSPNIRFVGPLLPYQSGSRHPFRHTAKIQQHKRVILVTQGTVERDPKKIIIPTLEAFKDDSQTLVIVTTGGSRTEELRAKYPQSNVIIDDFIDFNSVMPFADVYVTNGGYGGTMLALQHGLPLVAAGVHEGKNEITARIGYFKVGINLKTETPTAAKIRKSIEKVLSDPYYRINVQRLGAEFKQYATNSLCEKYILELLSESSPELAEKQTTLI